MYSEFSLKILIFIRIFGDLSKNSKYTLEKFRISSKKLKIFYRNNNFLKEICSYER